MGTPLTTCDGGVYYVCGANSERQDPQHTRQAKNEALTELNKRAHENTQLRVLSALVKSSADKEALHDQCATESSFHLLYRASQDGFHTQTLRKKCNDIAQIFFVITSVTNHVFGFYSSKGLRSDGINTYVADEDAFVFSLNEATGRRIFDIKSKANHTKYALFNSDTRLLHVGGTPDSEADICLIDKCNELNGSFINKNIYSANTTQLNGSNKYFIVKELLVYTISSRYLTSGVTIQDVDDDSLSYASSADFADYEEEYGTDHEHKVHIYIVDKDKESELKQPVLVSDIDENDVHYAGNVSGEWNDTLKRGETDLSVDITSCLRRLGIERTQCKVLVFVEDHVNGDKLERLDDDMLSDFYLYDNDASVITPNITETFEEKEQQDGYDITTIDLVRQKSAAVMEKKKQMAELRMKYSSRRVVLRGKRKKKQPKCSECNTYFHIQSDPINAYDGTGIVCGICHKNRTNNPELILDDHYYKCENCEAFDICSACYKNEKKKLNQQQQYID
eukprot:4547_1